MPMHIVAADTSARHIGMAAGKEDSPSRTFDGEAQRMAWRNTGRSGEGAYSEHIGRFFGDVEDLIKRDIEEATRTRPEEHKHWLVDSFYFKGGITVLVLLNTIVMGVEADHPELEHVMSFLEHAFTALFFAEMLVKIMVLTFSGYFDDRWNWLDFGLVWMAAIDIWVLNALGLGSNLQSFSILRILRLFRLVRVLRLSKNFRELSLVIQGVIDAMRTTCWVACVLLLAIYVGAIFCVTVLGEKSAQELYPGYSTETEFIDESEMMFNFNPYISFGSVFRAMLTLFNLAILAEWAEVVWPIFLKQPHLVIFFVFYVCFVTFGIMNVIIAMIVDSVDQRAREAKQQEDHVQEMQKKSALREIHDFVQLIDVDEENYVKLEDLQEVVSDMNRDQGGLADERTLMFRRLRAQFDLPKGLSSTEFLYMLSFEGSERMTRSEVVCAFYRLLDSTDAQQQCIIQMILHEVKHSVNAIKAHTEPREAWQAALDQRLESIEHAVKLTSNQLCMAMAQDDDFESHDYAETSSDRSPPSTEFGGDLSRDPRAALLDAGDLQSDRPQMQRFHAGASRELRFARMPDEVQVDDLQEELRESFASARRAVELSFMDASGEREYGPARSKGGVDQPRKLYRSDPSNPHGGENASGGDASNYIHFDNIFEDIYDVVATFDEEVEQLGLEILWHGELPMVGVVKPDGEAASRGVLSGDLICELNGEELGGMSRKKILKLLQQRPLRLALLRES